MTATRRSTRKKKRRLHGEFHWNYQDKYVLDLDECTAPTGRTTFTRHEPGRKQVQQTQQIAHLETCVETLTAKRSKHFAVNFARYDRALDNEIDSRPGR